MLWLFDRHRCVPGLLWLVWLSLECHGMNDLNQLVSQSVGQTLKRPNGVGSTIHEVSCCSRGRKLCRQTSNTMALCGNLQWTRSMAWLSLRSDVRNP